MSSIIEKKHNYIFIGESGSGKTELSLNMALKLKESGVEKVTFIDMDQTKGMFRARNHRETLEAHGVEFLETIEMADSPIVPQGVTTALTDPERTCVFDVGGNAVGALMIGQFEEYFTVENTVAYYVVNSYRSFSGDAEHIKKTFYHILVSSAIEPELVKFISNPCLGDETTVEDVLKGHAQLLADLKAMGYEVHAMTVNETLYEEVRERVECPVYPIRLFIQYFS